MQFTWDSLIDRARVYLDDDHKEESGWIKPANWLTLANVEYAQLYRRWLRMGLVAAPWVDATFTGFTTTVTGVLAVLGVAEQVDASRIRVLTPAQSAVGRSPFWALSTATKASYWDATGAADALTFTLEPRDATGSYFVRYIPTVDYATDSTTTVDVPYGTDERLVLGMARRAHLKESSASALLERLIADADAELNFTAFSRLNDSPRVRRVRRNPLTRPGVASTGFPTDPAVWRYS